MQEYRVFLIGSDGHIKAAEAFTCESDKEACLHARAVVTDCPVREVWSGDRKVAVIPYSEQPLPTTLDGSRATG